MSTTHARAHTITRRTSTVFRKIDDNQRMHKHIANKSDAHIRHCADMSLRLRIARDLFHMEVRLVRLLELMPTADMNLRIQIAHMCKVGDSTAESLTKSVLDQNSE